MIVLPPDRTKNGREHQLPLSTMALDVLAAQPRRIGREPVFGEGRGGFSGWSVSKQVLDQAAKLKATWTQHDLRRTAATRMADLGVQPHIIEAVLNHVSGHKSGVAGIYNRSSYAPRSGPPSSSGATTSASSSPKPRAATSIQSRRKERPDRLHQHPPIRPILPYLLKYIDIISIFRGWTKGKAGQVGQVELPR